MASRQFHFTESLGESTTTVAGVDGGSDKCTLTFTPDADATYAIFCSAVVSSDSATADRFVGIDIWEDSTLKYGAGFRPKEFTTPQDWGGFFAIVFYTAGSSPSPVSWRMNFYTNASGSTVRIKNARMTAVKLNDTHDHYITNYSDASIASTTSSTLQTWDTLTFTPASTGDYLIIGFGCILPDDNGGRTKISLYDGTTDYGAFDSYHPDNEGGLTACFIKRFNALSGSKSYSIRFASPDNAMWVGLMGAGILALRIDGFENVWEADSYTVASGTPTTYTDRLALSFTPAKAVKHLVFGAASFRIGSTTVSGYVQAILDNPSTTFCEIIHEGQNAAGYNTTPAFAAVVNLVASAANLKWQTKTESGTNTHYIDGQSLVVLQLETSASITGSLNAAIQRALSISAGANAAVAATRTAGLGADSATVALRTAGLAADGAAMALQTAAAQLASAIQAGRGGTLAADAALLQVANATAALEAAIAVGLDRQAALDVLVAAAAATDCALLADAAISAGRENFAAIDAAVQAARTATAVLDTAVRAGRLATGVLDSALAAAAAAVFAADAAVRAERAATAALSSAVLAGLAASLALDAMIGSVAAPLPPVLTLAGHLAEAASLRGERRTTTAFDARYSPLVRLAGGIGETDGEP